MAEKKTDKKPDWLTIKNEYVTKNITYEELAEKYGVSLSTLNKRASKGKWVEAREEYGKMLERKFRNRASNEQVREYVKVERSLLLLLRGIEESLDPVRKELYKYRITVDGNPNDTVELDQINTNHIETVLKLIDKAESLLSRLYGIIPAEKVKEYEIALKQAEAAVEENSGNGNITVMLADQTGEFSE